MLSLFLAQREGDRTLFVRVAIVVKCENHPSVCRARQIFWDATYSVAYGSKPSLLKFGRDTERILSMKRHTVMDISKIQEHMPVYAEGSGGLAGASDVHIGNIDSVDKGKYLKLTKHSAPDGQHHWCPIDWVRAVDERAVYLNKTVDEVMAQLLSEQPQ